MSFSKRLIETIEITANESQSESPSLHWYECLDRATLKATSGEHHFADLNPLYQQSLLKTPADLKRAVSKVTKELKLQGISHTAARKKAALLFGIENPEDVRRRSELPNAIQQKHHGKIQDLSGRKLVQTVVDFLALPSLIATVNNSRPVTIKVKQLDYIAVPIAPCMKHGLTPNLIEDQKTYLPIAVIQIDNQLIDYQLPLECAEYVVYESRNHAFSSEQYIINITDGQIDIIIEASKENSVPQHNLRSGKEWMNLPELPTPILASSNDNGAVFVVENISFYITTPSECNQLGLTAERLTDGRFALPIVCVKQDNASTYFRTPLELTGWIFQAIDLFRDSAGSLPSQIEFGVLGGRTYAEFL